MAKIKKDTSLRKAILQAAITGELISDVEGETETGKQLLDRIIEERKNKLSHGLDFANAKSGKRKSKKETALASSNPCDIPEDEIPFEIPENWCWCRLGDVSDIKSSKRVFEKDYVLKGIPFFRSAEIGDLQQNKALKTELFISERHFEELKKNYGVPQKGDLLITSVGTIGNTWISDGRNFYYKDGNITQISKNDFIIPEFYRLFINSPIFTMQVFDTVAGTAYNALTIIKLKNLFFPLPPLAVQNAIVAKLEEVLPLVDAYENAVLQKEELKSTLPDTLKKAILQEAIQGKLTEDWRIEMLKQVQHDGRTEETGKQLLDRIIQERKKMSHGLDFANAKSGKRKSKKETALAGSNPCDIPEDEIPFEIPESWCWCRLSEYLDIRDGTHDSPKFYDTGIPFVTSKNLNNGKVDFSECKYITEEDHKKFSARSFVEDGDILFAMIGSIGNPVMVKKEFDFSFKNMALFKCYSKENTNMKYIYFYLCHIQKELKEIATGGVQSFIGLGTFRELLFPLPPLAEQKKIVEILEQMLPLCEKLGG